MNCRAEAAIKARPKAHWSSLARSAPISSNGNVVAIACHNCYHVKPGASRKNLSATLKKIRRALRSGADIIELDVKEEAGYWYVGHDDDGSRYGPRLADVLSAPELQSGQRFLYVELKEREPTPTSVGNLLDEIVHLGFAVAGRVVVLRTFYDRAANVALARQLLASPRFRSHAAAVGIQLLYTKRDVDARAVASKLLRSAVRDGIDGVEFSYRSRRILDLLSEARTLGLTTNVYTLHSKRAAKQCARFSDLTDSITTDSVRVCRQAVELRK